MVENNHFAHESAPTTKVDGIVVQPIGNDIIQMNENYASAGGDLRPDDPLL